MTNVGNLLSRFTVVFTCLLFCHCKQISVVSERRPVFRPLAVAQAQADEIERHITEALKRGGRDPMASLADLLLAAETAARELKADPANTAVRDNYNFAVARILSTIQDANLDPWTKPLTVPAAGGDFTITRKPDARKEWNPSLYIFKSADQFDVSGAYIKTRSVKAGLGAPVIAIGREEVTDARARFSLPRTYYGVTAIARFQGRRCEIGFEDPLATETVRADGRTYPLAADYTVPVAMMLSSTRPDKQGLAGLLNPGKHAEAACITRLQPYDPEKTVVLVVHGLNDSHATWTHMINSLRDDETIRRNYQFWFYTYPSGWPYPHSAAVLRKELDAVKKRFPMKKKMVVIGHSMGGCISRLLITDVGDRMWLKFFDKPPSQVEMSEQSRRLFEDAIIFKARPEIGRVIFIAAPLQGADLAAGWVGRLGSRLVKAPFDLAEAGLEMLQVATFEGEPLKRKKMPNSVDTLAPDNRFVLAINTFPISPAVPYHTIVGDRGKGGNIDKTRPVKSDGVVPYWSSHLPGARSELIVPSGHSAHLHQDAVEEVRRILHLHKR